MATTVIEIDDEMLTAAARVLGTANPQDTVDAALREVGRRLPRLHALVALSAMADRGDFDAYLVRDV